jgi:hypothetical protein
VFCISTKNHPRAAVWVAGTTFMDNGQHHPYVRASESEAKKVSRMLTAGCGFDVPVRGVIAVANANTLTVKQQPGQVRIARRRHLVEWRSSQPHCLAVTPHGRPRKSLRLLLSLYPSTRPPCRPTAGTER